MIKVASCRSVNLAAKPLEWVASRHRRRGGKEPTVRPLEPLPAYAAVLENDRLGERFAFLDHRDHEHGQDGQARRSNVWAVE